MDILIGSIITALLFCGMFRVAGFNWPSSWLFAVIFAGGLGLSAARFLDRF